MIPIRECVPLVVALSPPPTIPTTSYPMVHGNRRDVVVVEDEFSGNAPQVVVVDHVGCEGDCLTPPVMAATTATQQQQQQYGEGGVHRHPNTILLRNDASSTITSLSSSSCDRYDTTYCCCSYCARTTTATTLPKQPSFEPDELSAISELLSPTSSMDSFAEWNENHMEDEVEIVESQWCIEVIDRAEYGGTFRTTTTSFGWEDFPLLTEEDDVVATTISSSHTTMASPPPTMAVTKATPATQIATTTRSNCVCSRTTMVHIPTESTTMTAVPMVTNAHPSTKVRFGFKQIREYSLQLGDHPLCSFYPISLDWLYASQDTIVDISIDLEQQQNELREVELCRSRAALQKWARQRMNPRRSCSCRHLDLRARRLRLATVLGVSVNEIDEMELKRHCQQQQSTDHDNSQLGDVDEVCTSGDDDDLFSTSASGTTTLPRVASSFTLIDEESACEVVDLTTRRTMSTWGVVQGQQQRCSRYFLVNDEYDSETWEENLLEMNMHVNSHVVHPGFEIQIQ